MLDCFRNCYRIHTITSARRIISDSYKCEPGLVDLQHFNYGYTSNFDALCAMSGFAHKISNRLLKIYTFNEILNLLANFKQSHFLRLGVI